MCFTSFALVSVDNEWVSALEYTYLQFCGRVFKQTSGTTMGLLVSVSVTNLVMEDIEEHALAIFEVPLPFWKRYVDFMGYVLPRAY